MGYSRLTDPKSKFYDLLKKNCLLIFVLDRKCVIGGGIAIVVVLIVIVTVVAVTVVTTEELLDVENRSVIIVGYVIIKIKTDGCV